MIPTIETYDIDSVDRAEVLRYMGYRGQTYSDEISELVDREIGLCLAAGRPRASIEVFDVAGVTNDEDVPVVALAGTALELRGRFIAEHLEGAVSAAVIAVTAGMGVERELRRRALTDPLAQLIFDAAGTALVERAADAAEASVIRMAAERDLYCNFRFSPGYGDLPLETQPMLLAALDAQRRLGITLSSSLLMTPTKSVTAIIGMFKEPQPKSHPSCAGCPLIDFCKIRPTGRTCRG